MAEDQSRSGSVVLVVEDDPESREVLVQLIGEALGYRVLSASCADDALRILDSGAHVDLIFSDIVMPGKDGLTLTQEVRRRAPHLPVLLATGYLEVVDSVITGGGLALLKPYSLARLEAVLTEQLYERTVL